MTTFASALRLHAVTERSDTRLDGAVAVRRCAQYRKAFRWAAVDAGVGRIVVNSATHIAELAATALRRQRVLIQSTDRPVEELAEDVVASECLDLIGLHRRLMPGDPGAAAVGAMIAAMERISQQHGVIPARLSLADVDVADWGRNVADLTAMSDAIGDAIETGCITAGFGRPAVNVSPSAAALVHGGQPAT